jgi:hypothetical protein
MPRDDDALRAVAEQTAAVLTAAGFPRMPSRILMALLVEDEGGLTAMELADRLGVSAGAISGGIRYLQSLGIVHRVARSGSRRDRYELPAESWYRALTKNPTYATMAALADRGVAAIDDPSSPASARMEDMAGFFRFLDERVPQLMNEWNDVRDGPSA